MRPIDWPWHFSSDHARLARRLPKLAKPTRSAFLLLISALIACSAFCATAPPDLVLYNGRVFTSDAARPNAQAIAIGGRFVIAVGTSGEVRGLAGPNTELINLEGRVAVPGFNDAHFHH